VKKFKKYLKRGLIALGMMIAILLITNAVFISIRGRLLEKKLEAIRTAGDPVSFPQLAQVAVPPVQNAAVFLSRAQASVENISKELYAVYTNEGFVDGRLSENDLRAIESALTASPDVIPLLRQAADCPEYDPQPDYTVDPQAFIANSLSRLGHLRAVIRFLAARVQLLVAQGDREEALQTCLCMIRLSRLFDREPSVIGFMVSLACRGVGIRAANSVLLSGPLLNSSHEALDAELALHDSTEAYVHALKSERVLGIESFQQFRTMIWPSGAMFLSDECDYLDMITEQLEFASRPFSDLIAAGLELKHQGQIGVHFQLVLPALMQCRKANDRIRAQMRCLRILNAVHSRADDGDKSEPMLADLGLPPNATTDPFTGAPLRLQKTADGWLVYSMGENLQDDGGDLSERRDVGVGPNRTAKDDR
jgi:hypothetical protein